MRVGTRLMIAVAPAVVGVLAVAGLAYWGQLSRQAPQLVVIAAAVAAVGSLLLAWWNTRYVAHRIERLAERSTDRVGATAGGRMDELDQIEESVHGLHDAVRAAQSERTEHAEAASQREAEMLTLFDDLATQLGEGVREVQLPLHILLESPFGELNENQEEILAAARAAAENADVRIRQVQRLLALDRGAVKMLPRPLGVAELLRPALAIAEARAAKRGVLLRPSIEATAPRVLVDPFHAQDAVTMTLTELIERVAPEHTLEVEATESGAGTVRVVISGAEPGALPSVALRLAEEIIRAQGGSFHRDGGAVTLEFPAEQARRARS